MPKAVSLLKIRSFKSVDYTTAETDVNQEVAVAATNVDTQRYPGALVSSRGRVNLVNLSQGSIASAYALAKFNLTTSVRNVIAAGTTGATAQVIVGYNLDTAVQFTVVNGTYFSQGVGAVQFGNILYTNGGQQIRYNAGVYTAYPWQNSVGFAATISLTPSATGGNMLAATYYYAMTTVTAYPDGGTQESNPNQFAFATGATVQGDTYPAPVTTTGTTSEVALSGGLSPWYGTNADGSTYTTNIYRISTNQPTWYLAGNANSGTVTGGASGTYTDTASDNSIATAQQLQYRYPAPATNAVIFGHQDRMWVFNDFENATLTNGLWQCQLWFSDQGLPWSFAADTNVILVGDNSDNYAGAVIAPSTLYAGVAGSASIINDLPMAGVSLSSVAILHKRRSTYILYGNDPSTYIALKMWDLGCVASASATVCEDVDCWLSEEGPQMTDGQTRQYIGEPMRELMAQWTPAQWALAVGWYADRTWFLSFPQTTGAGGVGYTLRYYLPKSAWLPPLPYATYAAYALPSETAPSPAAQRFNEVIAARGVFAASLTELDAWNAADGLDLGAEIASLWQSPMTDSGEPGLDKEYQWIVVNAPVQTATLTATLTIFTGVGATATASWVFDLSQGPTLIATIGTGGAGTVGSMAQLKLTTTAGAANPVVVYSVEVMGSVQREYAASAAGVT